MNTNSSLGVFRLIIAIALPFITAAGTDTSASNYVEQTYDREERAWKAVMDYLRWEKYWYGTHYAEECLSRLTGKKIPVTFYYVSRKSNYALLQKGICDTCNDAAEAIDSMVVSIGDSVLQFLVVGISDADDVNTKLRASIIPFDTDPADRCKPSHEYEQFSRKYREDSSVSISVHEKLISGIREGDYTPTAGKDMSQDAFVIDAVRKSVQLYRRVHSPAKVSAQAGLSKTKLRLGYFRSSDPYLLVYVPSEDHVYWIEFPSYEVLMRKSGCMEVFNESFYMGPNGEHSTEVAKRARQHMIQRLMAQSLVIEMTATTADSVPRCSK